MISYIRFGLAFAALLLTAACESPSRFTLADEVRLGSTAKLEGRLSNPASIAEINSYDKFGHTPLTAAILNKDADKVRLLIRYGADVNLPMRTQSAVATTTNPPLMLAVMFGDNPKIVRELVAKGADVEAPTVNNYSDGRRWTQTPLQNAVVSKKVQMVAALLSVGAKTNGISQAQMGDLLIAPGLTPEMADLLIANGANVNRATSDGSTPLCAAARNASVPLIVTLVSHGADVNAKVGGASLASCANNPVIVDTLVAMGLDSKSRDGRGLSAHDYAVRAEEAQARATAERQAQAEQARRQAAAEQARREAEAEKARRQAPSHPEQDSSSRGFGDMLFRQALGGAIQNLGGRVASEGGGAGAVLGGGLSGIGKNFAEGKDDPESSQAAMVAGAGQALAAQAMSRAAQSASGGGRSAPAAMGGGSGGQAAAAQCKSQAERATPYGTPQLDNLCQQATLYACLSSNGVGGAQTADYKNKTCAIVRSTASNLNANPNACRAC